MRSTIFIAGLAIGLASCVQTSVTPVANNQVILKTSAAPYCGSSGSEKVASEMAAIETLRRGFERYVIVDAASQNNVHTIVTGPTHASTSTNVTGYGNTVYGKSTTTYSGQQFWTTGSHDTGLSVLMLKPGDEGFENGIDAKQALGPDWARKLQSGVNTCF